MEANLNEVMSRGFLLELFKEDWAINLKNDGMSRQPIASKEIVRYQN